MKTWFSFLGGAQGAWRVTGMTTLSGDPLAPVSHVDMRAGDAPVADAAWVLRGFTSNIRYATAPEIVSLKAVQQPLGRPEARCAAMIPIRKTAAWWDMAQDERRAIFEETSHHNAIGLDYLPPIARRLHHCRDIGEQFDFVTWFDFAPEQTQQFDELVARLRATKEWAFIDREIDIRLERLDTATGGT